MICGRYLLIEKCCLLNKFDFKQGNSFELSGFLLFPTLRTLGMEHVKLSKVGKNQVVC
jgi:hypothetical protein